MNYQKIYDSIIRKRKDSPPKGQVERHHILPRCMGGEDNPDNLVYLTPKEHFICHYLLAKTHGGSLWSAYYFMAHPGTNSARGLYINSRQYALARKRYVSYLKTKTKEKNPNYGNSYSKEAKKKISKSRKKYTGRNHPRAFAEDCEWAHISGEKFIGSHFDLSEKTGESLGALRKLAKGEFFSYKGWTCPSSGRKNMRAGDNANTADKKVYRWMSPNGDVIEGTRHYMRKNHGLNHNGTSNLVRNVVKKHKGWSICL